MEGGWELHPPGRDHEWAWRLLAGEPLAGQPGELWQPPHRAQVDQSVPHQARYCQATDVVVISHHLGKGGKKRGNFHTGEGQNQSKLSLVSKGLFKMHFKLF